MVYVGWDDPAVIEPTIRRMLESNDESVREAGGRLAAFAGLELGVDDLFDAGIGNEDPHVRKGVATVCGHRLPIANDADRARAALSGLFNDEDADVRKEAGSVAAALRGSALGPHSELLLELIASPTFGPALGQLLITLERAPDANDELTFACADRFIEVHGDTVA